MYVPLIQIKQDAKTRTQGSLLESLGAVQSALAALPDNIIPMPKTLTDAFIMVDPVLSMLNKQLLDARAAMTQVAGMAGNDAMIEALATQINAIKSAYTQRLEAMRQRRDARKRKNTTCDEKPARETKAFFDPRLERPKKKQSNGALWIWALMLLYNDQAAYKRDLTKVA